MLFGNVRFRAVRGYTQRGHAAVMRHAQVFHGADARQQQCGNARTLQARNDAAQIFFVRVHREAVVHGSTAEAVAMRHFNERYTGFIEAFGHIHHLRERNLVTLRVHAVAQAHVMQGQGLAVQRGRGGRHSVVGGHGRVLRRPWAQSARR